MKELKQELETELNKVKGEKEKLEAGLIKEKKDQLEKLRNKFIEKRMGLVIKKREKIQNSLDIYLASVEEQMLYPNRRLALITKTKEENTY